MRISRVFGYLAFVVALAGLPGCRAADAPRAAAADLGPGDARPLEAQVRDARSGPAEHDPDVLGRAGPVTLDVAGFRVALDEARVLEQWRQGVSPPAAALADGRLRRRLMTHALETRVVRAEAAQRGLAPDPARFEEMMRLAAAGHRLESAPDPEVLATARALPDVDAALAARFGAPAERVRRVGRDVIEADLLTDALLAEVPDARMAEAWLKANTRIVLDLVRVGRVPTSAEIDRAVAERQPAIATWFEENQRLFRTPERAFVRRLLVPVAADAAPAEREAARQRAEALRAQAVADPGGFEALVRREAPPREARRVGRMTVGRTQMPAAFEGDLDALSSGPGPFSPVEATGEGWHFWRVEGHAPGTSRSLDDPRVQREIAAELLRGADELPSARRTAARVRQLLEQSPGGEALAALVKAERLQRSTTEPFDAAGAPIVPGVGLAPELFEAVFALTPEAPVSAPIHVRQHYVVARLVSREAPDPAAWADARERFVAEWRGRQRPRVIDEWLSKRLDGRPLWIDSARLQALTLAEMGFAEAPAPGGPPADGGEAGAPVEDAGR